MPNKKEIIKKKKGEVIHEAKISSISDLKKEKMCSKKRKVILIASIIIIILMLIVIFNGLKQKKTSKDFKIEYESLNGHLDRNGNQYYGITIDSENVIQYASYKKLFSILDHGTGILLFCAPEYPECRNIVPILLDTAEEVGVDTIYYRNLSSERDLKERNSQGKIITTKKGSKNYQKLLKKLDPILNAYEELEEPSIKRIHLPTIVFVKEGKIISSYIKATDQPEDWFQELSTEQRNMLKSNFSEKMSQIITCDETC